MSRTRTRNTVDATFSCPAYTSPTNWTVSCGGTITQAGPITFPAIAVNLEETNETIIDNLGRGKVNGCTHDKFHYKMGTYSGPLVHSSVVSGSPGVGHWNYSNASNFHYQVNEGYRGSYTGINPLTGLMNRWTVSGSVNEDSLKESVIEKARGLKADVLLNVIEANQIWPSVKSITLSLPNMAKNWKSLRSHIRTSSGAYLAWKFGVSPLLSDFMSIQRYMPKIGSDLKRHANSEKSRYVASAALTASYDSSSIPRSYVSGTLVEETTSQGRLQKPPMVRYVLVVKPSTKYHSEFFSNLDGLASRFATSPASLAWEKVPFSFVVDWFVDLRGTLRALDNVVGFSPYEVVGFSRSYGYSIAMDAFLNRFSICDGSTLASYGLVSAEQSHYERSPVSMGATMPQWIPRFGKSQAGISAALISQQLSKL